MPSETPISVIVDYWSMCSMYLEVISAWFCSYFPKNNLASIIKAFQKAERTSEKLDIPENCEKYLRNIVIHLLLSITVFYGTISFTNVILMRFPNYYLGQWLVFNVPRLASITYLTLFVWCLVIVERKFRRLNKKVHAFLQNYCIKAHGVMYQRKSINEISIAKSSCESTELFEKLTIILHSHRELRSLLNRIVRHFALFVMFNVTTQVTVIIFNVYAVYRFVKTHDFTELLDFLFVISFGVEMLFPLTILIIESSVCNSASYEANNMGNILHSILNHSDKSFDTEDSARLDVISLGLLLNKTRISVFGLFYLDHHFIYNTVPMATMYLVIMLQFYT
ncbi:putative gustatory receptor 28b [Venturia canescens]|uniref:putative gustatory receptor 28b n=1 Tax=Venturia canescens TaxID=32260 RepID=UPI001C9CFD7A|nr:putative gustatory receptor 28b [Venturia canescens]